MNAERGNRMGMREELHHLVDQISDKDLDEAVDYLRWLTSDEPEVLSAEEWAEVRSVTWSLLSASAATPNTRYDR
jgi:hypothetical protein